MAFNGGLTIASIRTVFAEEILAASGTVCDTYEDDVRLFTRSILPWVADVRPKDKVQGGVALRASNDQVCIHPYLFRQVCCNGAIVAHAIQSTHVQGLSELPIEDACSSLRAAIQGCCVEDAFTVATDEMRTACDVEADLALSMMSLFSRLPSEVVAMVLGEIVDRFSRKSDHSQFGLMNAVTSLARDTSDPELRWRLEELGGGIPITRAPTRSPDTSAAALLVAR